MNTLIFASNNAHKLHEIKAIVPEGFRVVSLEEAGVFEDLAETASTLEGNALMKAERVFERTGLPCFADDTGLEVEALDGAPGVYSARFAGPQRSDEDNMALLLQKLMDAPSRRARFRTAIALVGMGKPVVVEGIVSGEIVLEPRGTMGFGYDPVFMPEGHARTFAEMTGEEKNALSHRGRAVQALMRHLAQKS